MSQTSSVRRSVHDISKEHLPVDGDDSDSRIEARRDVESRGQEKPHGMLSQDPSTMNVTWKDRIKHFTWANYTLTMSTGGFALLISVQPHTFNKMLTLGTIVYILDLVFFVCNCTAMVTRFILDPSALRKSLTYPHECLFFATFWLSFPTIVGGMEQYGGAKTGPWLPVVLRVLFWIYCACTLTVAVTQYWYLFTCKQMLVKTMMPGWILPIFPVMLNGTLASLVSGVQPPDQRMPILITGITFQGLGMMVAFMMYGLFIMRLMEHGLPAPSTRPGMFICVGPPSFTALALIGMSKHLPENYSYFENNDAGLAAVKAMAVFTAVFLWGLSFWWFCIAVISNIAGARQMQFRLGWWAFVFPNVGFTIATINIGEQLKSEGVTWLASIMSIFIFATWLFVLSNHIYAIITKKILMPGLDEDAGNENDPVWEVYE